MKMLVLCREDTLLLIKALSKYKELIQFETFCGQHNDTNDRVENLLRKLRNCNYENNI